MMIVGLILAALGQFSFTRIGDDTSWLTHVLPGELLIGVGLALLFIALWSVALTGIEPADAGVASAALLTTQQVGGALGAALLSTFYATAVSSYLLSHHLPPLGPSGFNPAAAIHGYHVAFWIAGGFVVAALIAIVTLVTPIKDDAHAGRIETEGGFKE
jgi:hypothetical protein